MNPHISGETCGSVFWVKLNQRFHRTFPDDERYVAEVKLHCRICLPRPHPHHTYPPLLQLNTTDDTLDRSNGHC